MALDVENLQPMNLEQDDEHVPDGGIMAAQQSSGRRKPMLLLCGYAASDQSIKDFRASLSPHHA
jgi:hypothetical protein